MQKIRFITKEDYKLSGRREKSSTEKGSPRLYFSLFFLVFSLCVAFEVGKGRI
jgi:hypothetical protein